MSANTENVGIAMALVVGAGASTGLGAAVVFFPSVVKLASRRVLAASLGFSAGVMIYVSFVEIFSKSRIAFLDAGNEENIAHIYATACFFGGVLVMMLLNFLVAKLLGVSSQRQPGPVSVPTSTTNTETVVEDDTTLACCCSKDPVGRLENMQKMADELGNDENAQEEQSAEDDDFVDNLPLSDDASASDDSGDVVGDLEPGQEVSGKELEEKRRLVKMGLNTALAIGLHNFPEGLATFVAALNDPTVGGVLAFAIAIHNIPEGLCVALPIYYATGSRMKGFLWALLSGASEIVAALLGWAILASTVDQTMYATLFGLVAGMMVIISVRELLPTAHHYDPEDTVVTYSFIAGMFFMALSLVLFLI